MGAGGSAPEETRTPMRSSSSGDPTGTRQRAIVQVATSTKTAQTRAGKSDQTVRSDADSSEVSSAIAVLITSDPQVSAEHIVIASQLGLGLQCVEVTTAPLANGLDPVTVVTIKAEAAFQRLYQATGKECIVLVEETGLDVRALDGFPGANIRIFNDNLSGREEDVAKMLSMREDKSAAFRSALCLCWRDRVSGQLKREVFVGELRGRIVAQRSTRGSKTNDIFVPDEPDYDSCPDDARCVRVADRSLSQLTERERIAISSRRRAWEKIKVWSQYPAHSELFGHLAFPPRVVANFHGVHADEGEDFGSAFSEDEEEMPTTLALVTNDPQKMMEHIAIAKRLGFQLDTVRGVMMPLTKEQDPTEVVRIKAEAAFRHLAEGSRTGRPVLVEDLGLHVTALDGFPGANINVFNSHFDHREDEHARMLSIHEDKSAILRSALCVCWRDPVTHSLRKVVFVGELPGRIVQPPVCGSQSNSIFVPDEPSRDRALSANHDARRVIVAGRTLAQISPSEKGALSSTRRAWDKISLWSQDPEAKWMFERIRVV